MLYQSDYQSPLGSIVILCDETALKGIWFNDQKHYGAQFNLTHIPHQETGIIQQVKHHLTQYFNGLPVNISRDLLAPEGTPFQQRVFNILMDIPVGETMTYKEIAEQLAKQNGGKKSSPRAVGGAVGKNPISLFIPCHRVIGSDGSLTGYAGGVNRKIELLVLEGFDKEQLLTTKKATR